MTPAVIDAADEITERLARELVATMKDEVAFMEQQGVPRTLGAHFAVKALQRAAMQLEANDG